MTERTIGVLGPEARAELRAPIEREVGPSMTPDVSTYAPGRLRAWLRHEPRLGARPGASPDATYRPGLDAPGVWTRVEEAWARAAMPRPLALVLVIRGPVGIGPHRDASYAHADALSINLGAAEWGYATGRHTARDAPLRWRALADGEILRFDSKWIHASRNVAPDRYAILAWSAKIPLPRRARTRGTMR